LSLGKTVSPGRDVIFQELRIQSICGNETYRNPQEIKEIKIVETLNLQCSEPMQLHKVLSIPGIYPGDPIRYQGRNIKIDFDNLQYGDTPIMMDGQMVGVVPKAKIITSGNRVRATAGKFTSKDFASLVGSAVNTGAILEDVQMDGDTVISSRLKSFTVAASGRSYRSGTSPAQSGTTDDDSLADMLFKASGGGPSGAPEREERQSPVNHPPKIATHGERSPAPDNDDAIAEQLFSMTRGCSEQDHAAPDHGDPRRPERKTVFVGSGYKRGVDDAADDDERLAQQLFDASQ
jgi:hypothetical protein